MYRQVAALICMISHMIVGSKEKIIVKLHEVLSKNLNMKALFIGKIPHYNQLWKEILLCPPQKTREEPMYVLGILFVEKKKRKSGKILLDLPDMDVYGDRTRRAPRPSPFFLR